MNYGVPADATAGRRERAAQSWETLVSLLLPLMLALCRPAAAEEPSFAEHDVPSLLFIAKSDDRNRVDYGMRLNAKCEPTGDRAVFPYWREFEPPPPVRVHPLSGFEFLAYGIRREQPVGRTPKGFLYRLRLRQFDRDLTILTHRDGAGGCVAEVRMTIAGRQGMQLLSVFLQLGRFTPVEHVDVVGRDPRSGEAVTERITP